LIISRHKLFYLFLNFKNINDNLNLNWSIVIRKKTWRYVLAAGTKCTFFGPVKATKGINITINHTGLALLPFMHYLITIIPKKWQNWTELSFSIPASVVAPNNLVNNSITMPHINPIKSKTDMWCCTSSLSYTNIFTNQRQCSKSYILCA
jgi:hypothetical protein